MSRRILSRRHFIRSAAAVLAAPAIVPSACSDARPPATASPWPPWRGQPGRQQVCRISSQHPGRRPASSRLRLFQGAPGGVSRPRQSPLRRKRLRPDGRLAGSAGPAGHRRGPHHQHAPIHWHVCPWPSHAAPAKKTCYVEKPLGVAWPGPAKLRQAAAANNVIFPNTEPSSARPRNSSGPWSSSATAYTERSKSNRTLVQADQCGRRACYAAVLRRLFSTTTTPDPEFRPGWNNEMWIGPGPHEALPPRPAAWNGALSHL